MGAIEVNRVIAEFMEPDTSEIEECDFWEAETSIPSPGAGRYWIENIIPAPITRDRIAQVEQRLEELDEGREMDYIEHLIEILSDGAHHYALEDMYFKIRTASPEDCARAAAETIREMEQ